MRKFFSWLKLATLPVVLLTSVIAAPAALALPSPWNFTVRVGLSPDLVTKYGGLAATEADVNSQLSTISGRFSGFAAPIKFTANDFYVYSDDPMTEISTPHPNSNFLLVYSEQPNLSGGWYGGNQAVLHDWTYQGQGVFDPYATDGLTHEFGHSRGAVDVYAESVDASSNPISGTAFSAPASYMTYPYGATAWDAYSRGVINASRSNVYQGAPIVDSAFPAMRVEVKNSSGVVVSGSTVTVYPVVWYASSVQTTPAITGKTSTTGYLPLKTNPFAPGTAGQPWNLAAPNFLVKATKNGHTGYGWLPLSSVGAWYFQHPGTTYTLVIKQK